MSEKMGWFCGAGNLQKFAGVFLSAFGNWKKKNGWERGIRKNSCNQNVWKSEGWEKGNWADS